MVSNRLLIGIDVSKYRKEIRNEDKYKPYVENHIGYEMEIVDDTENNHFTYFGKVLGYGNVKAESDIIDFNTIANKVIEEYKNLFREKVYPEDIKLISCTILW